MEPKKSPPPYENGIYLGKANIQNQETLQAPDPEEKIALKCEITLKNVKIIFHIVNTLTHFLLGGVVLSAVMIANSGTVLGSYVNGIPFSAAFKQHIYLCVTGYMVLMSQAILSFNPHGGWAHALQNTQKRMIHAAMQVFGSILALVGCIIKIADSYNNVYPMSNKGHKVTGWIVLFLTIFSLIGGILNFKYNEKISQGPFKNAHTHLGYLVIFMAFICLALAFGEGYYYYFNSKISSDLSVTFTVFALIGLLISASSVKMK